MNIGNIGFLFHEALLHLALLICVVFLGALAVQLIVSLIRHLESQGLTGVWPWLAGMVIPLFLYFLFWRLRVFGAADGKLLAVCGSYVGLQGVFFVLFFTENAL